MWVVVVVVRGLVLRRRKEGTEGGETREKEREREREREARKKAAAAGGNQEERGERRLFRHSPNFSGTHHTVLSLSLTVCILLGKAGKNT